jgi:chromosome segregation ATPase
MGVLLKRHLTEGALAALTVVCTVVLLVLPAEDLRTHSAMLAVFIGTVSLLLLVSLRRTLRGLLVRLRVLGKISDSLEQLDRSRQVLDARLVDLSGEVRSEREVASSRHRDAERSRVSADMRTHERLAAVLTTTGKMRQDLQDLRQLSGALNAGVSSTRTAVAELDQYTRNHERSRSRADNRTHEILRSVQSHSDQLEKRLIQATNRTQDVEESVAALRDTLVEIVVTLDVVLASEGAARQSSRARDRS